MVFARSRGSETPSAHLLCPPNPTALGSLPVVLSRGLCALALCKSPGAAGTGLTAHSELFFLDSLPTPAYMVPGCEAHRPVETDATGEQAPLAPIVMLSLETWQAGEALLLSSTFLCGCTE